jgi:hypothetical protein
MEIVAHGLWTAAAAITASRTAKVRVPVGWAMWWGAFPDVLAFGPPIAVGLWMRLTGPPPAADGHLLPHLHFGVPLYPAAHSVLTFAVAFTLASLLARRPIYSMLGWLLHILIDIPTHSYSYYATRFLWPLSEFRIDGVAWWTRWFWAATYLALAAVYYLLWRKGWLAPGRVPAEAAEPVAAAGRESVSARHRDRV